MELLQKLRGALPEARLWIDRQLAAHQAKARSVASYAFKQLPRHYSPDLLATAKVVEIEHVPMLPLSELGLTEFAEFEAGQYAGITFKNTYFAMPDEAASEALHFHELVHVIQWGYLGVDGFLMAYSLGYLQATGADKYRGNPLEAMAYELQDRFERGTLSGDVQREVQARLDAVLPKIFAPFKL